MKPLIIISPVLAAALLAPLMVLADASAQPSDKRTAPIAKKNTPAADTSVKGVARTSKTAMGARVNYTIEPPVTGQTTEVRLRIEGRLVGQPLSVEVMAGDGLQLVRGLPGGRVEQSDAASDYVIAIAPVTDGLHYLHVFLRSGAMSEALAIAIQVGKGQGLAKPVTPKVMPDGRSILSIPAQQ